MGRYSQKNAEQSGRGDRNRLLRVDKEDWTHHLNLPDGAGRDYKKTGKNDA